MGTNHGLLVGLMGLVRINLTNSVNITHLYYSIQGEERIIQLEQF